MINKLCSIVFSVVANVVVILTQHSLFIFNIILALFFCFRFFFTSYINGCLQKVRRFTVKDPKTIWFIKTRSQKCSQFKSRVI